MTLQSALSLSYMRTTIISSAEPSKKDVHKWSLREPGLNLQFLVVLYDLTLAAAQNHYHQMSRFTFILDSKSDHSNDIHKSF